MNYHNWQKVQKEALTPRPQIIKTTPANTESFLAIHRRRAWFQLTQFCTRQQLENLCRLAWEYDRGQRTV